MLCCLFPACEVFSHLYVQVLFLSLPRRNSGPAAWGVLVIHLWWSLAATTMISAAGQLASRESDRRKRPPEDSDLCRSGSSPLKQVNLCNIFDIMRNTTKNVFAEDCVTYLITDIPT